MSEIIYRSAKSIAAAAYARGTFSAAEVVEAHLARIEEVNGRPERRRPVSPPTGRETEARRADDALARGRNLGPLHGVPITLKDSIDTQGVVTTGGTMGRVGFVPDRDSTVAARLRAAGAILLGKTNTPELTLAGETNNLVYGRTNNPYDLSRMPGGSSGGAGAISRLWRFAARHGQRHRRQYPPALPLLRHRRHQAQLRSRTAHRPHRALRHGRGRLAHPARPDGPVRRGPGARPTHHRRPGLARPGHCAGAARRSRRRRGRVAARRHAHR